VAAYLVPELAGLTPEQAQGALRMMKPERVAQIREFAGKVQGIAQAQQQLAFSQQQHAQAAQAEEAQRRQQAL